MSTTDDRPHKVCPDCAETVRAAARKCRFCGFRFDGAQREAEEDGWRGIFGLGRQSGPSTIPALLAGWGFELENEEQVDTFVMVEVDGKAGFLLLTDARFVFFEDHGKACTLAEERSLSELERVELVRPGLRRKLRIGWERSTTLVGSLERATLRDLHERLLAHVPA